MRKKKGFTLIELLVVIAIIAMLLAILMPALSKVKKIAQRVVCGTNLKGLGTAQTVYAQDYDDEYAVQGRGAAHTWGDITADWQNPLKDWSIGDSITVSASLYLLVRQADVSPKSFVCPSSNQKAYDGANPGNYDIVELWDFASPTYQGNGAENCVSYSYQQPYVAVGGTGSGSKGRYAANGSLSASFAVMADQNPWFETTLIAAKANQQNYKDHVWKLGNDDATDVDGLSNSKLQKFQIEVANALPHDRESQNVLFADGHSSNEKRTDVGVKNDNIYLNQVDNSGSPFWIRTGSIMNNKEDKASPQSSSDSVLVNDGGLAQ